LTNRFKFIPQKKNFPEISHQEIFRENEKTQKKKIPRIEYINKTKRKEKKMSLSGEEMFYLATGLVDVNSWTSSSVDDSTANRCTGKFIQPPL